MYRIEYGKFARKTLHKMPKNTRSRIIEKINALAVSPYQATNIKKLSASDNIYRLRVADWRVIYLVEDKKMLIYIQKISTRGGVYK
jgi:mRNA interferase RelE/StbE